MIRLFMEIIGILAVFVVGGLLGNSLMYSVYYSLEIDVDQYEL